MAESDANLWMWIAGFFGTAWMGLLTVLNRTQTESIKEKVPRKEYEAEKENTNRQLGEVKEGINGIHTRLDSIFENRRTDKRHEE